MAILILVMGIVSIGRTPTDIFPNCPRYIPRLELIEPSIYSPKLGEAPVEPAWKAMPLFSDVTPPRHRAD